MNTNLSAYKLLRVFVRTSNWQLINLMFCTTIMSSRFVLRSAGLLYAVGSFGPGRYFTDKFVNHTFGRTFTCGNSYEEVKDTLE